MKTVSQMITESTSVPTKLVDGCMIYQHSIDVDVIGITVFPKEEDGKVFLFKDAEFTKPVTDYELLSLYFGNTRIFEVDNDGGLSLSSLDLTTSALTTKEYKHGQYVKHFFNIDEVFSGQTYADLTKQAEAEDEEGGEETNSALVGTAVVGQDTVGQDENENTGADPSDISQILDR